MTPTRTIAATAALLALVGAGVSTGFAGAQPATPGPLPGPAPSPTVAPAPAPAPIRGRLPGPAPAAEPAPSAAEAPSPSTEAAPTSEAAAPSEEAPSSEAAPSEAAPSEAAPSEAAPSEAAPSADAAPPAGAQTSIEQDGTYAVNTQLVPGTYVSAGPVEGGVCYWKRLGQGENGEIIDNAMTKKPQTVTIEATDTAFNTSGCQPWQKSDAAKPTPPLPPVVSGLQLRQWLNTIDNNARQSGNGALPPR